MPDYGSATTLIVATDHGRGNTPADWRNHGEKVPEARNVWMAFLGPDTPGLGERREIRPVGQNQIAATLAAFLGELYRKEFPAAGEPIADVLPR
jgi:hypothetical protein